METTLAVAAIKEGSVIDHIPAGQGMQIVKLLKLYPNTLKNWNCGCAKPADLSDQITSNASSCLGKPITLGLNLPSPTLGYKDIIKIEEREITPEEANQIAIFAPKATINIIKEYKIEKKFTLSLPQTIKQLLICPNPHCITNHEQVVTQFKVTRMGRHVNLECHYCQRGFIHDH